MSLAIRTASASSSNGMTAATGPKTSSRATRSRSWPRRACTGTRTRPLRRLAPENGSPSTNDATFSRCCGRDQRPISVASSAGSPTLTPRVRRPGAPGNGRRPTAGRGSASVRSSPGRRCRTRRRARRRPPARGRRRRRHVGRLAAELQRHALDCRRRPHHLAADLGRAREADLGDVRVLDQPPPDDRARADDDVDHALGDARLECELGEPERRERRQLGGLQHDRVAARERRPELPARDDQREVPGHDQPTTPSGSRKVASTPPATGIVSP